MRNGETHFEQVPIEVAETVFRQAAAQGHMPDKSPTPVPAQERQPVAEIPKQEESASAKGQR
jgi:hypothetical protein